MKVVLNRAVGSCFSLSPAAITKLSMLKGRDLGQRDLTHTSESGRPDWVLNLERSDSDLVGLVEGLGSAASGPDAELMIVEIPEGCSWKINDVVGYEFVVVNGKSV